MLNKDYNFGLAKQINESLDNYFDESNIIANTDERYPNTIAKIKNTNIAGRWSKGSLYISFYADNGVMYLYDNENNAKLSITYLLSIYAKDRKGATVKEISKRLVKPIVNDSVGFTKKMNFLFAEPNDTSMKLEKLEKLKDFIDKSPNETQAYKFYEIYNSLREAREIELDKRRWKKYTNGKKIVKAAHCPEGYWHVTDTPPNSVIHVDFSCNISAKGLLDD